MANIRHLHKTVYKGPQIIHQNLGVFISNNTSA